MIKLLGFAILPLRAIIGAEGGDRFTNLSERAKKVNAYGFDHSGSQTPFYQLQRNWKKRGGRG